MKFEMIEKNGVMIAHVTSGDVVLKDLWSALDVVILVRGKAGVKNFLISKELIAPEFFDISTGFAEKIQSKLVKFGMRCAIYGEFGENANRALAEFINSSNVGDTMFFVPTKEIAAERLSISLL